jgi:hypothetical protein
MLYNSTFRVDKTIEAEQWEVPVGVLGPRGGGHGELLSRHGVSVSYAQR